MIGTVAQTVGSLCLRMYAPSTSEGIAKHSDRRPVHQCPACGSGPSALAAVRTSQVCSGTPRSPFRRDARSDVSCYSPTRILTTQAPPKTARARKTTSRAISRAGCAVCEGCANGLSAAAPWPSNSAPTLRYPGRAAGLVREFWSRGSGGAGCRTGASCSKRGASESTRSLSDGRRTCTLQVMTNHLTQFLIDILGKILGTALGALLSFLVGRRLAAPAARPKRRRRR